MTLIIIAGALACLVFAVLPWCVGRLAGTIARIALKNIRPP